MKKYNVYKATRDISEIVQGCTFFCDGVSEELIKSCDTLDEAKEVLAKYKTDITACDDCYLVTIDTGILIQNESTCFDRCFLLF